MKKCNPIKPECSDKDSTHYFMCHMTQKDWAKRRGWSDIKKTWEYQYHYNKIRMKEIDKYDPK